MKQGLWRCVRPFLFALESERAHGWALRALSSGLVRNAKFADERLRVRVGGLEFANPLGLAAGFDKNGEAMHGLFRLGFSHIEIGTLTPQPQVGNPKPRLFRLEQDKALINRMGFNNQGHEALFQRLKQRRSTGVLGLNIGANKNSVHRIEDYIKGFERFFAYVDYFTVNISSPNTPGLRDLQAREALDELLTKLQITRLKIEQEGSADQNVPVFLKIAPDLSESALDDIADCVLSHHCDGLVISNTTLSRPGLSSFKAGETGGLSGRPLFEVATIVLAKMRQRVGTKLPIIGVGGIENAEMALEKIRAGADLVQILSALIFEGPHIVVQILRDLADFCTRDGVEHIGQYRDQHVHKWAQLPLEGLEKR